MRVSGDDAEDARRSTSENMRLERRRKLLAEAELSAKARSRALLSPAILCFAQRNAAVAMKWAALLEFDVPVDLLEAMRVQKTACETIVGRSSASGFNLAYVTGSRYKGRVDPRVSSKLEVKR